MGFFVLSSFPPSNDTSISQVNALYRRLSDLETNVYKRFGVVTSMSRDTFTHGINPLELRMFTESLQRLSFRADGAVLCRVLQRALDDYIRNICDLSYMIQSFKKPLIIYANGVTGGFGACMVSIANVGACYKHSRMRWNNLEFGVPLLGGQSYVLAMLRGSLGEYLALTGHELKGEDLIWSGLVKRFISPDAFGVMQLTAERLVEMPEKETEFQIQEHFMPLETNYSLDKFEWLIHEHFSMPSVASIISSLDRGVPLTKLRSQTSLSEKYVRDWEARVLDMITQYTKDKHDDADTILNLIRDTRAYKLEVFKTLKLSPNRWKELQQFVHRPAVTAHDHNNRELLHSIHAEILLEALQLEASSFLHTVGKTAHASKDTVWSVSQFSKYPFTPCYRSGVSLSSLPCLRKLHPDYDASTGSDHDALRMKRHSERWSDDFLQRELLLMRRILTTS
ncbi:hypothetical protein X943_000266 [Babesia divergens]|uniref:Enoyl-CoA hydratase/isomerase domain-containing protein n=1 Tax=Babesia divergens TaxID=32595 RepID=A0AAD9GJK5_BABDI|nr:hypothetical protein X943_000266 [Babesia divergens]